MILFINIWNDVVCFWDIIKDKGRDLINCLKVMVGNKIKLCFLGLVYLLN